MERFFRWTLTFLISSVALLQFIQVIARYVLALPLPELEEVLLYPTLWLYMMGSVNASRENTQISANVLEIFLKKERAKKLLHCVAQSLSLGIVCWLLYWGIDYERYARRVWKEGGSLYLPTYYAELALPLGLALMTLYTGYNLFKAVKDFRTDKAPQGGSA